MKINILIVDDQRLMREGLKTILSLEEDFEITDLAENGSDALDKIKTTEPDVILMDIRMPIMNGVECTAAVKARYPKIKVLVLTTFDDDEYIFDALKNGAEGYLLKDLPSEKLISSIRDVHLGNSIMQPEIAAKIVSHIRKPDEQESKKEICKSDNQPIEELTSREKDILKYIAKGQSNREIAATLFISEGTVKNYISSIYDKLGINERSKIIIYAMQNGYTKG